MQGRCPTAVPADLAARAPGLVARRSSQQCLLLADRDLFDWPFVTFANQFSIWLDSLYLRLERSLAAAPPAEATLVRFISAVGPVNETFGSALWMTELAMQGDGAPGCSALESGSGSVQLLGLPPLAPVSMAPMCL